MPEIQRAKGVGMKQLGFNDSGRVYLTVFGTIQKRDGSIVYLYRHPASVGPHKPTHPREPNYIRPGYDKRTGW